MTQIKTKIVYVCNICGKESTPQVMKDNMVYPECQSGYLSDLLKRKIDGYDKNCTFCNENGLAVDGE